MSFLTTRGLFGETSILVDRKMESQTGHFPQHFPQLGRRFGLDGLALSWKQTGKDKQAGRGKQKAMGPSSLLLWASMKKDPLQGARTGPLRLIAGSVEGCHCCALKRRLWAGMKNIRCCAEVLNKSGSGPRRLPSAVVVSFAATDLQHISISSSISTHFHWYLAPGNRPAGQHRIKRSAICNSFLPSNHESSLCRVADAQAVPQHTRPDSGPQRPGVAGLHGQHHHSGGGVACRERRFEMRTAHDPRPPASFLYALSQQQQLQTTAIHPQLGSPVQARALPCVMVHQQRTV